ncbi:DUF2188 domain-containing protein [Virgibacillus sp. C22-A2]|uniref:DUF2188 domain-containing protein n=1 Tax=Virgibacillus tibetensis TaxID=3042313 RepID=A0ABU6KEV8_9BACI|nr:DUF2188 domain-containing protein [Virgibacillus sp. C22-A2]
MKTYSVAPNVDATAWFIKLEDVAPEEVYDSKDEAIADAKKMAEENSPSKVEILDKNHTILEEINY